MLGLGKYLGVEQLRAGNVVGGQLQRMVFGRRAAVASDADAQHRLRGLRHDLPVHRIIRLPPLRGGNPGQHAQDGMRHDIHGAGTEFAALGAALENRGDIFPEGVVAPLDLALLIRVQERHFAQRGQLGLVLAQHAVDEGFDDSHRSAIALAERVELLRHDRAGALIALERKVLLVAEVVIQGGTGHPQALGDIGKRSTRDAAAVQGSCDLLQHAIALGAAVDPRLGTSFHGVLSSSRPAGRRSMHMILKGCRNGAGIR
ncbi:hypothetical protein D3C80_1330270 [compost metagenome]